MAQGDLLIGALVRLNLPACTQEALSAASASSLSKQADLRRGPGPFDTALQAAVHFEKLTRLLLCQALA